MRSELLKYAAAEVPRYTSYPTAVQFQPAVDESVYRRWLANLEAGQGLSAYIHIPFCRQLCWYCGCHTRMARDDAPLHRYLDLLETELAQVGEAMGARGEVVHLHFGGGTPSLLEEPDFARLMAKIDCALGLASRADVAMEMDPRSLSAENVAGFARAGVTRASLGVQDISPEVQALINRIQPFEQVERSVAWLRHAGISSINVDLMYGLPKQSCADVARSAEAVAGLGADRVSVFGYAHVPWFKKHQQVIRDADLPGIEERMEQAETAAQMLQGAGYRRIGFDHFARPDDTMARQEKGGSLRRNFQGYTTDAAKVLLGLGASAIGTLPEGYVQNTPDLRRYGQDLSTGHLPTCRGVTLSDDDRLRRHVIERIMCDREVDIGQICRAEGFAEEALDGGLERLLPLAEDGLLALGGRRLAITSDGLAFRRSIAACFDAYLVPSEQQRHSKAV